MHERLIRRCLELAELGRGRVSPNPLVGCMIVDREGKVIAEGWHREFGKPHAEAAAIATAMAEIRNPKSEIRSLKEATLYVNLEPCHHHGKTPPCTEAIVTSGIRRIVFGARDPSNAGSEILRKAGVEVIGPILEPECRRLNKGFFSLMEQGRPWVTVKKALRRDGSVPGERVTGNEQDQWSHGWLRGTHDAILVGSGTIIADNPRLTVRYEIKNKKSETKNMVQPRRVILDPRREIPKDATVLTDEDAGRTIVIREKMLIPELLQYLKEEGIASVLIEGGPRVWRSFEESGCLDERVVLVGRDLVR